MHSETTEEAIAAPALPRYMPLPSSGTRDPYYGMTRSWWLKHAIPCEYNGHKPPIRSIDIRKDKAAIKGRRYIVTGSADEFFEKLEREAAV